MNKLSKRIAISVASVLIAASMVQTASAAERTKKHHFAATANEQVRNANAAVAVDQDEIARYRNGAGSGLAGH